MTPFRFHATQLFDGHKFLLDQVITITDGVISSIDQNINDVDVKAEGLVVPGYIDLCLCSLHQRRGANHRYQSDRGSIFIDCPSNGDLHRYDIRQS